MLYTLFIGGGVSAIPGHHQQRAEDARGHAARARAPARARRKRLALGSSRRRSSRRLRGDVRFDGGAFSLPVAGPICRCCAASRSTRGAGEKIALVGPSGAGKSTLVSLLLRFYEPECGRAPARWRRMPARCRLDAVRGNMAIVPQEVLLFGGSIRENIAYGRPGAAEEEIRAAAERAHCHEFIARFPEGYDTLVGERGVKLSGGQRQRLAIARALLQRSRDPDSRRGHQLARQRKRSAHPARARRRCSRVARHSSSRTASPPCGSADRICVLENGVITETGTHAELMAAPSGTYRRLAELQFSGAPHSPTPAEPLEAARA